MISIFSCPKGFRDKSDVIQRNALQSWIIGAPGCDIILVGDDPGVAEAAKEFGVRNAPHYDKSPMGAPILPSVFHEGLSAAKHDIVAYMNADIIVPPKFLEIVERCIANIPTDKPFLIYGGRWNLDINDAIDFKDPKWHEKMMERARTTGWFDQNIAMEYFIFRKSTDWRFPPLRIGRFSWDSWLPWRIHQEGGLLIDSTQALQILHPNHTYSYFTQQEFRPFTPEERMNYQMLGFGHRYTLRDATHTLNDDGSLSPHPHSNLRERLTECRLWVSYLMRGPIYPYSYPLYWAWKLIKKLG